MSAADDYAARVDAVLAQRTRLRGPQPPGDLYADLPPDHPLLATNPRRPPEPNLAILASCLVPEDVVIDVGGGAGRFGLPLALRCREVVNVDPSPTMRAAFQANAARAGIGNARVVPGDWLAVDPPRGSVALVNHVTYLTREIVAFVEQLERAAWRRVLLTVGCPPSPSANAAVFEVVAGEPAVVVPGHVELLAVLHELGIAPEVRTLPDLMAHPRTAATREAAIADAVSLLRGHQWAFWPLDRALEEEARRRIEACFDDLFERTTEGYRSRWVARGRDVLITWEPRRRAT